MDGNKGVVSRRNYNGKKERSFSVKKFGLVGGKKQRKNLTEKAGEFFFFFQFVGFVGGFFLIVWVGGQKVRFIG